MGSGPICSERRTSRSVANSLSVRRFFSPLEILRQVTSNNAALLQQEGKLGCVSAGAYADLIVVDGDPLNDIELLSADGRHLALIMRAGELVKNELH